MRSLKLLIDADAW